MAKGITPPEHIVELDNVDIQLKHTIEDYIANRQPANSASASAISSKWQGVDLRPQDALGIPNLIGMPKNCLPLLIIYWTSAANPLILGILPDTRFVYGSIRKIRRRKESDVYNLSICSGLHELFSTYMDQITRKRHGYIYGIYLIEIYRRFVIDLRGLYPKIAHLLIDPPELSPEIREDWQKFEEEIVGY